MNVSFLFFRTANCASAYAQVVTMLGNGRVKAKLFEDDNDVSDEKDEKDRRKTNEPLTAHIRGTMRKKIWINQGDIILVSLRDFQKDKGDVILKYSADEARSLKAYGELPSSAKINETDTYVHDNDDAIGIEFDEDRDGSEEAEIDVDDI